VVPARPRTDRRRRADRPRTGLPLAAAPLVRHRGRGPRRGAGRRPGTGAAGAGGGGGGRGARGTHLRRQPGGDPVPGLRAGARRRVRAAGLAPRGLPSAARGRPRATVALGDRRRRPHLPAADRGDGLRRAALPRGRPGDAAGRRDGGRACPLRRALPGVGRGRRAALALALSELPAGRLRSGGRRARGARAPPRHRPGAARDRPAADPQPGGRDPRLPDGGPAGGRALRADLPRAGRPGPGGRLARRPPPLRGGEVPRADPAPRRSDVAGVAAGRASCRATASR